MKRLVKIINKHDKVVEYERDRIIRSITSAIIDSGDKWEPGIRSEKYSKMVEQRVEREFYDLNWLKSDFINKYINYKEEERERRLENAFVTERLSFILLSEYRERYNKQEPDEKELENFILEEIESSEINREVPHELFPKLIKEDVEKISKYLLEKVIKISSQEITDDLLFPNREYIQDTIEKELKDIGEVEIAEAYMIYREGKKKIRENDIMPVQFTNDGINKELVRSILKWNIEHECDSVFALNEWLTGKRSKDIRELIKLSEERYYKQVEHAAKKILEKKDDIKVVIIAGPSCSNKTTTTVIVGNILQNQGFKLKLLNVDNYFKNLREQPKDEFGDYDFEMPQAIDMKLLNENLADLLKGREVKMPHYNFKIGERDYYFDYHIEKDEIILIDCLHGLYRDLTNAVPKRNKFKIYIESMNIIRDIQGNYTRWADIRMLKRMIRDSQHRGYSTEHTLAHWPYVRKGELKHIIPYIYSTDVVINSGLPYELPVLKKSLSGKLPNREYIYNLKKDRRLDPYIRGLRVLNLLDTVEDFPDLNFVPGTSPIREFIGGSEYIIPHNE